MQVYERLRRILKELEEINETLRSKAVGKAIENIKIALHGEKIGGEGFEHSYIRSKLIELLGGNVYVESEQTGISKLGFRPDLIVIKGEDVYLIEIETDKRRALRKMKRLAEKLEELKRHPVVTNRNLRVLFVLKSYDERLLEIANAFDFEVLDVENLKSVRDSFAHADRRGSRR